jgi:hypothetical protein
MQSLSKQDGQSTRCSSIDRRRTIERRARDVLVVNRKEEPKTIESSVFITVDALQMTLHDLRRESVGRLNEAEEQKRVCNEIVDVEQKSVVMIREGQR